MPGSVLGSYKYFSAPVNLTPLHYAIRCRNGGTSSAIFHLIIRGADVDAKNNNGEAAREDIK